VLAARQDERYLGYAFVRVRPGAGFAASWRFSHPLAELATLAVLPAYRGRGIGSELMDAVEARLRERGIADLAIGVVATNVHAMGFYERRGALPFQTQLIQRVGPNRATTHVPGA
jgi:ribosomal protein S18 acetylase RimI-like enzyme